jgi:hypothetical protein
MAVVDVKLIRSRQMSVDRDGKNKGSQTWRVRCDSTSDDASTALAATPDTPLAGVPMKEKEAKEVTDAPRVGTIFEVTATYEPKEKEEDPDDPETAEDPRERPLAVRLSFVTSEEDIHQAQEAPTAANAADAPVDISLWWKWGSSIGNSIGDPFPAGLKEKFVDAVITVSREVDTNDFPTVWDLLRKLANTVNVRAFEIEYRGQKYKVPKGEGLLGEPTSEPKTVKLSTGETVQTEAISVSWTVRTGGWKRKVLDEGYNRAAGPDSDPNPHKKRACTDQNGEPSSVPQNLNGMGVPINTAAGELPVFLSFRTKKDGAHTPLINLLNA